MNFLYKDYVFYKNNNKIIEKWNSFCFDIERIIKLKA